MNLFPAICAAAALAVCDLRASQVAPFLPGVPTFAVSTAGKWTEFGSPHPDAAAAAPGCEWLYGEPNTIAKFRRMGFNAVNLFAFPVDFLGLLSNEPPCADPADDFPQLLRLGREEGWLDALMPKWTQNATWWTNFVAQSRALGDTPFYVDLHVGQLSRLSNAQDALKGKLDLDTVFYNHGAKPLAIFNMAFRLTRPEGAEAIAALYRRDAENYRRLNARPFAYKLLNEPSCTDDTPELRDQAAAWMRSVGVGPTGAALEIGCRRWREELSARAMAHVRARLREIEPDVPAFIQTHGGSAWRTAWTGIDSYKMSRAMDIVSIGTGGGAYVGDAALEGLRFADALDPNCAESLASKAYHRALAHGKPLVASEFYFGGRGDRRRELEGGLWHLAADGIALANLWEWGTPKKPDGNRVSYALYDPLVCAPETWDALPRIVREINSLGDFFPLGVRRAGTRVACLFPSATRIVDPDRTAHFCKAVSALEFVQIRADAILEEQLPPGDDCRAGDYDAIVAAGASALFPETDEALVRWMDNGGTLFIFDSPMGLDDFGRPLANPPRCLSHPRAVRLEDGLPVFRRALELRDALARAGIRPAAEVRDENTGDLAPFVRAMRVEGDGGLVCWFVANYSTTPRLVSIAAEDFSRPGAVAVSPLGAEAWPIVDGRLLLSLPGQFHMLAAVGDPVALTRRFGEKSPIGVGEVRARHKELRNVFLASARRRESIPIDLSALASGGFDNQQSFPVGTVWEDSHGRDLRGVPFHRQVFANIDFDILRFDYNQNRTTLAMSSASRPDGIRDTGAIPLGNRQLRSLAFLHAATHAKEGEAAYGFEVRYEDGEVFRQPVRVGREIGSWQIDDNAAAMEKACVWKNDEGKGLFLYEWENPRPSEPIASLRIMGGEEGSCGNVVAVSALPTRFTKRFSRRIEVEKGPFLARRGERPSFSPKGGAAWPLSRQEIETGVLRFEFAHRPRPGEQPRLQSSSLAATGLFASGAEGRTSESAVMAIFGEMARQREKSVASPDEWAEIEIPLAMLARAVAPNGGEDRLAELTSIIFAEQASLDYAYRNVRLEFAPVPVR